MSSQYQGYELLDYPAGSVRLDLNESPFPPPREVLEAMIAELGRVNRYPEAGLVKATLEAIAFYNSVDPGMIALTGGGDYGIFTILSLYSSYKRVVVPQYTFTMTPRIAELLGLEVVKIPVTLKGEEWRIDEDKLFAEAQKGGIIVLDHPNNPTGQLLLASKKIVELAQEAKGIVLVDEAYYEFSGETLAHTIPENPRILVLRTMSKAFSLAGMRIGYIIAEQSIASKLSALAPFPTSRPALVAARILASQPEHVKTIVDYIRNEREKLTTELRQLRVKPYPSRTNFILVETGIPNIVEALRKMQVYVKKTVINNTTLRVTIGTRNDNTKFLEALKTILTQ